MLLQIADNYIGLTHSICRTVPAQMMALRFDLSIDPNIFDCSYNFHWKCKLILVQSCYSWLLLSFTVWQRLYLAWIVGHFECFMVL
jgi:hypothetical protein